MQKHPSCSRCWRWAALHLATLERYSGAVRFTPNECCYIDVLGPAATCKTQGQKNSAAGKAQSETSGGTSQGCSRKGTFCSIWASNTCQSCGARQSWGAKCNDNNTNTSARCTTMSYSTRSAPQTKYRGVIQTCCAFEKGHTHNYKSSEIFADKG